MIALSRVLWDDDAGAPPEGDAMEFRLTYEGPLLGASKTDTRATHKHAIRCHFHPQLRRLWETSKPLRDMRAIDPERGHVLVPPMTRIAWLRDQYRRADYDFVPLVTEDLLLHCGISILFLRPDPPGSLIQSGDLDNRLKTLFDAFRLPKDKAEFGQYRAPDADEQPFFCLLEDDRLITRVAVETDVLLAPVSAPPDRNDARLVITVNLRLVSRTWQNGAFE